MDFERLNVDIKEMRRRNRGLALTVGLLAAAHVLALVVILNLLGTVRTVVVPPSINKSFWVSRDKASGEYLEQMGAFIAWLVLDVTPASIDWKKDILLGYVEPDQHGELKTRQELEAARLKRINASTFFMPQQLVPSEDTQTVVVRGRLRTLVNGLETANDAKAYEVGFAYSGGRMHLKSFKEVTHAAPCLPAAAPSPRCTNSDGCNGARFPDTPLVPLGRRMGGRDKPARSRSAGQRAAGAGRPRRRGRRGRAVDQGAHAHPHRRRADHGRVRQHPLQQLQPRRAVFQR